ncbi:MAG: acylphosphatase [Chloroflexota bacterium]
MTGESDPTVRLEATVLGRVQGVGFRYHVLRRAMSLGLTGWVANERDGTVRCQAEGPRPALEALLEMLQTGPAGALVDRVIATWGPATGTQGPFRIKSGGHPGD